MVFLDNCGVGQVVQANGSHSCAGKGRTLPGDSISQTPTPRHRPVLLINSPGAPQSDLSTLVLLYHRAFALSIENLT